MRQSIGALQVPIQNEAGELITQISVTVSGGVAQLRPREDGAGLYRRADAALYKAKQSGRNQVCVEQPTRPPG
jgi:PleD family two-component response regulator